MTLTETALTPETAAELFRGAAHVLQRRRIPGQGDCEFDWNPGPGRPGIRFQNGVISDRPGSALIAPTGNRHKIGDALQIYGAARYPLPGPDEPELITTQIEMIDSDTLLQTLTLDDAFLPLFHLALRCWTSGMNGVLLYSQPFMANPTAREYWCANQFVAHADSRLRTWIERPDQAPPESLPSTELQWPNERHPDGEHTLRTLLDQRVQTSRDHQLAALRAQVLPGLLDARSRLDRQGLRLSLLSGQGREDHVFNPDEIHITAPRRELFSEAPFTHTVRAAWEEPNAPAMILDLGPTTLNLPAELCVGLMDLWSGWMTQLETAQGDISGLRLVLRPVNGPASEWTALCRPAQQDLRFTFTRQGADGRFGRPDTVAVMPASSGAMGQWARQLIRVTSTYLMTTLPDLMSRPNPYDQMDV